MGARARPTHQPEQAALRALFQAIASGDAPLALQLLARSPSLARSALEVGATRAAAKPYFFDSIQHYVYARDTALHVAAAAHQPDLARELLSRGASASARNRRGAEPLHYAADGSPGSPSWDPEAQYAIVELLVKAGADPNSEDKSGVAPLHRAVRTRCTGAVRALLALGADAQRKNKSGSTPLFLAAQTTGRGGSGSATSRAEQSEIMRLLFEHCTGMRS